MSQYSQSFYARLKSLESEEDKFSFLLECACEAQSTEANTLGLKELVAEPRTETLARLSLVVNDKYPGEDEWVFARLSQLCLSLNAPFRPVLQMSIKYEQEMIHPPLTREQIWK